MSITKTKGKLRLEIMRVHRLLEFYDVFDAYLAGIATAKQVEIRARKMLEIGLPKNFKL